MIWKTATAIAALAALSGCVSATAPSDASQQLARAFESRIVSCTLPYLYDPDARVAIAYRYRDGATHFSVTPHDAALQTHLVECAAPETGPRARFAGKIEIWSKR
jgi:hypothetical protein